MLQQLANAVLLKIRDSRHVHLEKNKLEKEKEKNSRNQGLSIASPFVFILIVLSPYGFFTSTIRTACINRSDLVSSPSFPFSTTLAIWPGIRRCHCFT